MRSREKGQPHRPANPVDVAGVIEVWGGDGVVPEYERKRVAEIERKERDKRDEELAALLAQERDVLDIEIAHQERQEREKEKVRIGCWRFEAPKYYKIKGKNVATFQACLEGEDEIAKIMPGELRREVTFQYPPWPDPEKPLEIPVVMTFTKARVTLFKRKHPMPDESDEDQDGLDRLANPPIYSFQIEYESECRGRPKK